MNQSLQTATSPSTTFSEARVFEAWRVQTALAAAGAASAAAMPEQIHGGNIATAQELAQASRPADGVWLTEAGILVGITTADCAPVVVMSVAGALLLHASRKSLVRGLLDNALTYLEPSNIDHIFVGPHISEYRFSFEHEESLLRRFRERYPRAVHLHKGKLYLSLRKALTQIFSDWGVHPDKITFDGRCTYDTPYLPSYRRWLDGGKQGTLDHLHTTVWREAR